MKAPLYRILYIINLIIIWPIALTIRSLEVVLAGIIYVPAWVIFGDRCIPYLDDMLGIDNSFLYSEEGETSPVFKLSNKIDKFIDYKLEEHK